MGSKIIYLETDFLCELVSTGFCRVTSYWTTKLRVIEFWHGKCIYILNTLKYMYCVTSNNHTLCDSLNWPKTLVLVSIYIYLLLYWAKHLHRWVYTYIYYFHQIFGRFHFGRIFSFLPMSWSTNKSGIEQTYQNKHSYFGKLYQNNWSYFGTVISFKRSIIRKWYLIT